jgi:DNA repair exonuclease SbcCD ATPase subunit
MGKYKPDFEALYGNAIRLLYEAGQRELGHLRQIKVSQHERDLYIKRYDEECTKRQELHVKNCVLNLEIRNLKDRLASRTDEYGDAKREISTLSTRVKELEQANKENYDNWKDAQVGIAMLRNAMANALSRSSQFN